MFVYLFPLRVSLFFVFFLINPEVNGLRWLWTLLSFWDTSSSVKPTKSLERIRPSQRTHFSASTNKPESSLGNSLKSISGFHTHAHMHMSTHVTYIYTNMHTLHLSTNTQRNNFKFWAGNLCYEPTKLNIKFDSSCDRIWRLMWKWLLVQGCASKTNQEWWDNDRKGKWQEGDGTHLPIIQALWRQANLKPVWVI